MICSPPDSRTPLIALVAAHITLASKHAPELEVLKGIVELYLEKNSRRFVDLGQLFSFIRV